jgi:hypothetical protein
MADRRHTPFADACCVLGGTTMFASAFVHWVSRGAGSGLRGHALVDALIGLGRHVPALSATRLTVVWYAVPAIGAAALVACGLTGARSRGTRVVALVAVAIAVTAAVAFAHLAGAGHLGWGAKLALGGAALLVGASWLPRVVPSKLRMRRRRSSTMTARARSSVVRAGDS